MDTHLLVLLLFLGILSGTVRSQYSVSETAEVGHVVFTHDRGGQNCWILTSDANKDYFKFNGKQCIVNITADLETDETLCSKLDHLVKLKYECLNNGDFTAYIKVLPVDEFPPKFNSDNDYIGDIDENQPKGTSVTDFAGKVKDEDCGDVKFVYNIQDSTGTGTFKFDGSRVITQKVLDYENDLHVYNLTITAENDPNDNSNGIQTATAILMVSLQDMDDMNPIFTHLLYTLYVTEENSSFVNTDLSSVPAVFAYDQDYGINQTLHYSLQDENSFITIGLFNGYLKLNTTLDREKQASYSYRIKANQNDSDQRVAYSRLEVVVEDINDNHALFSETSLRKTIPENLAKGSYVTVVQATDKDEGINAEFNYTIDGDVFIIDPKSGAIRVANASALDRETIETMTVQISTIPVTPVINSNTCLKCILTLIITLSDENDNAPIFSQPAGYIFAIKSNNIGEKVGQVNATDADLHENAKVTYSIDGNNDIFMIEADSGGITLSKQTVIPTNFLAKACDNPIITNLKRCTVVNVKVVNKDNSTTSGHDIVSKISENLPVGTIVTNIPFYTNQLQFILEDNTAIEIEESLIKTKAVLDREQKQYYNVQLTLKDGSTVVNTYFINITVLDQNDNSPKFNSSSYSFTLPENVKENTVIGRVQATDEDEGENGIVTYKIKGQSSSFSIDPYSGDITMVSVPNLSFTQQFVELLVRAADNGKPSLQSITNVQINVGGNNGTLRIPVSASKDTINEKKSYYEKSLSDNILQVNTVIRNISMYGAGSIIYISATNKTTDSLIPLDELSRLVQLNMAAIQKLFMSKVNIVEPKSNNLSTEAIALICVACVVLVGSIALTGFTIYKFKRYQRLQRLVHSLSRKNSIYETQETSISIEDENLNDDSISTQHLIPDSELLSGNAVSATNQGFQSDELNTETDTDTNYEPVDTNPTEPAPATPDATEIVPEPDLDYGDIPDSSPYQTQSAAGQIDSPSEPVTDYEPNDVNKSADDVDESADGVDESANDVDESVDELPEDPNVVTSTEENDSLPDETLTMPTEDEPVDIDNTVDEEPPSTTVFNIPAPPPPPVINLKPMSTSSSMTDITKSPSTKPVTVKSPVYQNVLLELLSKVRNKEGEGSEQSDTEDKEEDDDESTDVKTSPIKFENWTEGLDNNVDNDKQGSTNNDDTEDNLEEPEPDYAKRVRFNEKESLDIKTPDTDDLDPQMKENGEIHSPQDSLTNGESGTFMFGTIEITEL